MTELAVPNHSDQELTDILELSGIRTRTPRMIRLLDCVRLCAALEGPVLVQGETGAGKELVADALHAPAPGPAGPW